LRCGAIFKKVSNFARFCVTIESIPMSVKFEKNQKIFDAGDCFRDLNLLAHAQMLELSIGSQCGGHGRCGADRIRLSSDDLQKVNPSTAIERHQLTSEQLRQGIRLACQCFPNENGLSILAVVV
jgi:ferredoxin